MYNIYRKFLSQLLFSSLLFSHCTTCQQPKQQPGLLEQTTGDQALPSSPCHTSLLSAYNPPATNSWPSRLMLKPWQLGLAFLSLNPISSQAAIDFNTGYCPNLPLPQSLSERVWTPSPYEMAILSKKRAQTHPALVESQASRDFPIRTLL